MQNYLIKKIISENNKSTSDNIKKNKKRFQIMKYLPPEFWFDIFCRKFMRLYAFHETILNAITKARIYIKSNNGKVIQNSSTLFIATGQNDKNPLIQR